MVSELLVGVIQAEYLKFGNYGCRLEDITTIPGGVKCAVHFATDPPFTLGATLREGSYSMVNDVPKEVGIVDIAMVSDEDADVVKKNQEFREEYLHEPFFAVVTARKA